MYFVFYVFSSFVEPDVPEGWGKDVSMVRDAEVATLRTPHSMFFTFNGAKVRQCPNPILYFFNFL